MPEAGGTRPTQTRLMETRPTALEALRRGDCCIVATDTVYGLAALPGSRGYDEIFRLKRRPADQVLPWLVGAAGALDELADDVPAYARELVARHWPGAITLVVRASAAARVLGGVASDGTVALRCPDEASCLALARDLGRPIACTSANLHGKPAVSRIGDLASDFWALPGFDELPAACKGGRPSTIVDCTGPEPRVLREGPIFC